MFFAEPETKDNSYCL